MFKQMISDLETLRDELRVKLHLANQDLKDQWDSLDDRWSRFSSEARLAESGGQVAEALQNVGHELKQGYKRLRDAMPD
ncbi:MAG: hypothetical protein AAF438_19295 [Pseudomonadota bacterium]